MGKKRKVPTHEDSDHEESDNEHELERAALYGHEAPAEKTFINQESKILEQLEDIETSLTWDETLDITTNESASSKVVNVHDDLQRELAFYELSILGVLEAQKRFDAAGVDHKRPVDYYAEMVKTDDHMAKVRHKLLEDENSAKIAEEKRKQRLARKYGKQVQVERQKEKAAEKKDHMQAIDKWRKERKQGGGSEKLPLDMDDMKHRTKRPRESTRATQAKRDARNKKFGSGARDKKMAKLNSSDSAHDMSNFNWKKNKQVPKGMERKGKAGKAGKGKASRPGKSARNRGNKR